MVNRGKVVLGMRAVQTLLSVVILGLMAYVSAWWTTHWRAMSPSEVNFLVFSPVWSILALVALLVVPAKLPALAASSPVKLGLFALEVLTMLYWFGGFIALAVFLRDRICFGAVCDVAKAGTVLSAINWVAWAASVVVNGVLVFRREAVAPMLKEPKMEMHQRA